VNDYRPNAETVGDAGVYFSGTEGVPDLARQLQKLIAAPSVVATYRERARNRAQMYSWDAVATAYEHLLLEVHGGTGPGPLQLDRVEEIERATRIAGAG
jgi:glycosyltransferase involved in cell wall biosynthesis